MTKYQKESFKSYRMQLNYEHVWHNRYYSAAYSQGHL